MPENQPEIVSLDLTKFAKDFFSENNEFDLKKEVDTQKHFEPIPNGFYGFSIDLKDVFEGWAIDHRFMVNDPDIIDITYEDLTDQKLLK